MSRVLGLLTASLLAAVPAAAAPGPAAVDASYGYRGVVVLRADVATLTADGRAVGVRDGLVLERVGLDGRVRRTRALVRGLDVTAIAVRGRTVAVAGRRDGRGVVAFVRGGSVRALVGAEPPRFPERTFFHLVLDAGGAAYLADYYGEIARVDPDGAVDPEWARLDAEITDLAWGPRGLLVLGQRDLGSDVHGFIQYDPFLARLDGGGDPDRDFDGDGFVDLGDGETTALLPHRAAALVATTVCGVFKDSPCNTFGFRRIGADGGAGRGAYTPDLTGDVEALAVERDGDVLAAGLADDRSGRSSGFWVRRFTGGRRLDRGFGRCGHGAAPHTPPHTAVNRLAVQRSGRIVGLLGGYDGTPVRPRLMALRGGDARRARC
ncbi:MAG TPA: hypothetical protein VHF89_09510 [Solirubrobacteraceae bacterium]|nr:hypothetical protein [Solirubrobacteraceae bacterium]